MGGFSEDEIGTDHEAHLSTFENAPSADARVSCAHEDARWTCCHSCAPRKGPGAPQRLVDSAFGCLLSGMRPGRLTEPAQFEAVLAGGRRTGSRCFLVRAMPNAGEGPRLGLIVGKKAAPRAVDRNRVKRIARIVHRQLATELEALDVVVQLRDSPRRHDNAVLFKELQGLLRELLEPGRG